MLGETDEALKEFREAIRLKPGDNISHSCLGFVLGEQGKTDEAIAAYRKAIELEPKWSGDEHFKLGNTLFKQGNTKEAEKEFREAERAYREDFGEEWALSNSKVFENLAVTLDAQGQRKEARVYWKKAKKLEKRPEWTKIIRKRLVERD